jgi:hypothetical protein
MIRYGRPKLSGGLMIVSKAKATARKNSLRCTTASAAAGGEVAYKYTVADAVLKVFAANPKRQREELLRIFAFLSREPFTEGETTQPDHTGRICQGKRFGDRLIVCWPEHLVSEIHILDAERLVRTKN